MEFLCLDFVNTKWYLTHKLMIEPLTDKEWMNQLYQKWNLPSLKSERLLNTNTLTSLFEIRKLLDSILHDLCHKHQINDTDFKKFNKHLEKYAFHKNLYMENGKYKVKTIVDTTDDNILIFLIITSFMELITEYTIDRLKCCENPDCGWYYYDESRNHTRKWCDNTCASLIKVRRYREKKNR